MSEAKPLPARVVTDTDILAADLLVDGPTGAALDHLQRRSWTTLAANDLLLDDAEAVVSSLASADLTVD